MVPIRIVRPYAYTDVLLCRSGIAWFGNPVKADVLFGAVAKAIDGWSLQSSSVRAGCSAPGSLSVSTARLASAELVNYETVETVEFAVRGLFHPNLVHNTKQMVSFTQGPCLEVIRQAQKDSKGILFPDILEGSSAGYVGMLKGAGLAGAADNLVVASFGKMPSGLLAEKSLLGQPVAFLSTEKAETNGLVLTVPSELKVALSSFAGDPLPTFDIVFCNGRVGDDIFQATAFEVPRSYDVNAAAQLAHALRQIKPGGTILVRFAARLMDQPVLYELVFSVLSWFVSFMIFRVELCSGHSMGYLVLKTYQYPYYRMSLRGRANYEIVLATHEHQLSGFLQGLYLAASYKASARVSPDFWLVQELIQAPHVFEWSSSRIEFVRHVDRLQFVASPNQMLKEAYDPNLNHVRGGLDYGSGPFVNWERGRNTLLSAYCGKLRAKMVPRYKLYAVCPMITSADDFLQYYVGGVRVQWGPKHVLTGIQARVVWGALRGYSTPECARHILNQTKLLISEERLEWFLSTLLEPLPGYGVPVWSLNHRLPGVASPFARHVGVVVGNDDPDLSIKACFEPVLLGDSDTDPHQYLQYKMGSGGDLNSIHCTPHKVSGVSVAELALQVLDFMPARFTIRQVIDYAREQWEKKVDPEEVLSCLLADGHIRQSAGGHFMRVF